MTWVFDDLGGWIGRRIASGDDPDSVESNWVDRAWLVMQEWGRVPERGNAQRPTRSARG